MKLFKYEIIKPLKNETLYTFGDSLAELVDNAKLYKDETARNVSDQEYSDTLRVIAEEYRLQFSSVAMKIEN